MKMLFKSFDGSYLAHKVFHFGNMRNDFSLIKGEHCLKLGYLLVLINIIKLS